MIKSIELRGSEEDFFMAEIYFEYLSRKLSGNTDKD